MYNIFITGFMELDKEHSYYYQIQQQLALSESRFCDFYIWAPNETFYQRIEYEEDFWVETRNLAIEFHKKVIMPELLGRLFTKSTPSIPTWCSCHDVDDGRPMICCANDNCNISWFHFACVNLIDVPDDIWFCANCF